MDFNREPDRFTLASIQSSYKLMRRWRMQLSHFDPSGALLDPLPHILAARGMRKFCQNSGRNQHFLKYLCDEIRLPNGDEIAERRGVGNDHERCKRSEYFSKLFASRCNSFGP
jgi:hypothetical protein